MVQSIIQLTNIECLEIVKLPDRLAVIHIFKFITDDYIEVLNNDISRLAIYFNSQLRKDKNFIIKMAALVDI